MMTITELTAEDAIVLALGSATIALCVWWIVSVAAWVVVLRRTDPQVASPLQRVAVPGSRRLAQALVAASLAAAPACSPGGQASEIPTLEWVEHQTSTTAVPTTALPTTAPPTTAGPTKEPAAIEAQPTDHLLIEPQVPDPVTDDQPVASSHVVIQGEHLWSIASTYASALKGAPATATETAAYWRQLIDLNRHSLFSGDPDLIHPGETLRLV